MDIPDIDSGLLFQGSVLIGVLTYIATQLRGLPVYIWERIKRALFYSVYIDQTDPLYYAIERWLSHHHKKEWDLYT